MDRRSRPIEIKSDTDFRSELADAAYQALLQLSARKALGDRLKSFTEAAAGLQGRGVLRWQRRVLLRARTRSTAPRATSSGI